MDGLSKKTKTDSGASIAEFVLCAEDTTGIAITIRQRDSPGRLFVAQGGLRKMEYILFIVLMTYVALRYGGPLDT